MILYVLYCLYQLLCGSQLFNWHLTFPFLFFIASYSCFAFSNFFFLIKVDFVLRSATINFPCITFSLAHIFDDLDPGEPLEQDNFDAESEDLETFSFLVSFSPSLHQLLALYMKEKTYSSISANQSSS